MRRTTVTSSALARATVLIAFITSPAAAQRASSGDFEHLPGSPLSFELQTPADWNVEEITYDAGAIGRDSFLRRAFRSSLPTCPAATTCCYARLFLDDRLRPGEHTVTFTPTGGRQARPFSGRLRVGARDDDGDGLPDVWENDHDLNRLAGTGHDGANGDPDGDGVQNVDEFRAGTMPTGRYRYTFGESSAGDRQRMAPCFVSSQPEQRFSALRIRLIGDDGRVQILRYGGCGLQNEVQGTYETPTIRRYRFRVPAERLLAVPLVNTALGAEPPGAISTIVQSAVITSRPVGGGQTPAVVVGRATRGGELGVRQALTESFVATRLR